MRRRSIQAAGESGGIQDSLTQGELLGAVVEFLTKKRKSQKWVANHATPKKEGKEEPLLAREVSMYHSSKLRDSPGEDPKRNVGMLRKSLHRRHVTTGQLFFMMDRDRDDKVTFKEFKHGVAMAGVRPIPSEAEMRAVFESFDVNDDNTLSYPEVIAALVSDAEMARGHTQVVSKGSHLSATLRSNVSHSPSRSPQRSLSPTRDSFGSKLSHARDSVSRLKGEARKQGWVRVLGGKSPADRWTEIVDDAINTGANIAASGGTPAHAGEEAARRARVS